MVKPFLPDIIKDIVARVDASFSARATDPFDVFFDKGLLQQVIKSVNKADENFPLVWLVYVQATGVLSVAFTKATCTTSLVSYAAVICTTPL